jgi:V/A-type H+-transporting ATPase subunit E
MAEELQSLLERIKKDGVDKAQAEADSILADARQKAAGIVAQAGQEAKVTLEEAEKTVRASTERGRKSLEQAARDILLSIGGAINATLREMVRRDVAQSLDEATLRQMLLKAVDAYCGKEGEKTRLAVLLSPEDQKKLASSLLSQFAGDARRGVQIKSDGSIVRGFRVSVNNGNVEHDFTEEAIVDALCQIVRPQLADIVRSAVAGK